MGKSQSETDEMDDDLGVPLFEDTTIELNIYQSQKGQNSFKKTCAPFIC
jgi:hypothetical protein